MRKSIFPHALSAVVIGFFLIFGQATNAQSALDGFDPNANDVVRVVVVQPSGKILIGGDFTTVSPNGGAAVTRNRIALLNPDGTLDTAFNPNADNNVFSIATQSDGKILIGGAFTSLSPNGGAAVTRNHIARLNADGTLDSTFNPNADDQINSIAVQSDGKIIIGGFFSTLSPNDSAAVTRNNIARLNADGTLDSTFNPNADSGVYSIAVQPDSKILIGGLFTSLSPNGGAAIARNRVARLNADGMGDTMFNPNADDQLYSIAVQSDGKILIGGLFTSLSPNGGAAIARNRVARLNSDGTLDTSFNPNPDNNVFSIAVQSDGKILIGGAFTSLSLNGGAAVTRNHIARLERDGTLDSTFDPNADVNLISIAIQSDGKVLVGGAFTSIAGQTRNRIARLERD
ncbi:MAG TPA: delta-60 repeat domain-containing protein, partial [Pyrinomonadaceae bacterium]